MCVMALSRTDHQTARVSLSTYGAAATPPVVFYSTGGEPRHREFYSAAILSHF